MLLILASTISPFLTVSSRLFLEVKSYITRMRRSFDSPELKNTSKGVRNVWGFKHLILVWALVCTVRFVGGVVVVSTWLKSTQKKHKVLLFFFLLPPSLQTACLSALVNVWCQGSPGWVQVQVEHSSVCSQVFWVQVLQTLQEAASRQRTPACMLGCPRHLRAILCW